MSGRYFNTPASIWCGLGLLFVIGSLSGCQEVQPIDTDISRVSSNGTSPASTTSASTPASTTSPASPTSSDTDIETGSSSGTSGEEGGSSGGGEEGGSSGEGEDAGAACEKKEGGTPNGQDCRSTGLCESSCETCYEKDQYWAGCKKSCKPGIDPDEPEKWQTPWTCREVKPGEAPAAGGAGGGGSAPGSWDHRAMAMTHYWDCNGQGCDAGTLQPWDQGRYVSPPGYGPQDPNAHGGSVYGEKMWLTGAASDALSHVMGGGDDGCCGHDPNGPGGCGKCLLISNPDSLHPDWTAVIMKKNRCPPHTNGCDSNQPHVDIAAPGFDNLQWSTANICGERHGTGFHNKHQSEALGNWYKQCQNTAECQHLCDQIPGEFQAGCKLFASWGWKRGDPKNAKFQAVDCPPRFKQHIASQFGAHGVR